VLLQEVKRWLENRGHATDFIPAVLERSQADIGEKAATLRKAQQAAAIGHTTAKQLRAAIRDGAPAHVLMTAEQVRKYDPDVQ
jgi:hypothetical protein